MSLNWNLEDIENYKEVCWVPTGDGKFELNTNTYSLIWATMGVGLGSITEENVEEFYIRLQIHEKLSGFERGIEFDTVKKHIGLRTNVSNETWAKWTKRMMDFERKEIEWKLASAQAADN